MKSLIKAISAHLVSSVPIIAIVFTTKIPSLAMRPLFLLKQRVKEGRSGRGFYMAMASYFERLAADNKSRSPRACLFVTSFVIRMSVVVTFSQ
jgi:hypothetical protein